MQGKGKCPLPLQPIPKTNNNNKTKTKNKIKVVYTEDLTHPANVDVQSAKAPSWFCLRLDVYPPPQVLQTNGCFYHSPLPSFLLEFLHNSRASSLHGHYSASLLLLAPPPPSRRPPFSRCRRLYSFLLRGFSPRDEEGFSSCLMRPCHRAAAIAPPERLAASVSLQRSVLSSLPNSEFDPWI